MLTVEFSRGRQRRLIERMNDAKLDAVVVGASHHVYYLSAFLPDWKHHAALLIEKDGKTTLVSANSPATNAAADLSLSYEANWFSTMRSEQPAAAARAILEALNRSGAESVGIDSSVVTSNVAAVLHDVTLVDEILFQLRRPKDPDELALMKFAIRATESMYMRAREIIHPGLTEIRMFNELHSVAVERLGAPMNMPLGNDYTCGGGGGAPRDGRAAKDGELWILDLGPNYRGYFADTCRTLAVNKNPTDAQHRAWENVTATFATVESMAKPGSRCRDIFEAVDRQLSIARGAGMSHHLGHGVGLQPHEYPHLNLKWDDTLLKGEVFTVEPGEYGEALAGGLRIENQYLVTDEGVENLVEFPMSLL